MAKTKIKFATGTSEASTRRKFNPRPITQDEFEGMLEIYELVNKSRHRREEEKGSKYTERKAFENYTWNDYSVGFLIETLKEKFKQESNK